MAKLLQISHFIFILLLLFYFLPLFILYEMVSLQCGQAVDGQAAPD